MNSLEDFEKFYLNQIDEPRNQSDYDELKEEEYNEVKEIKRDNNEDKTIPKKRIIRKANSKRSLPKRYQTYRLDYKKQIVAKVTKIF